MGGTTLRAFWLGGVILLAACGSRQSQSTTAAGGGEDVAVQDPAEVQATDDIRIAAPPPVEAEEAVEEPEVSEEQPARRDLKMVSYEEAMARPLEIGDASTDGGEAQLSGDEVAHIMDSHLDEMYEECIRKEVERENPLGTVTIDLAIRGRDGMILGATIDSGRRRFKKCLESYLEDVWFPKFASPRMGARYRFHVG